jgi:hypothetical protein
MINFDRFNTEANNDVVKIYKGTTTNDSLVASYSGDNIPPAVTVNGANALVTFNTNGTSVEPGWNLSYSSKSNDWCYNKKIFTDIEGTFTDGSGGYNYQNNTNCRWEIIPSNGGAVRLVFDSFKTEPENDYVEVYDLKTDQLLGQYSGDYTSSDLPSPVIASSGQMFVLFISNACTTDEGWSASWTTLPLDVKEQPDLQNCQVYPNPASGQIFLQLSAASGTDLSVEFISADGKVQLSQKFETTGGMNKQSFDVSALNSGVYILKVISDKGVITRKVIIN